MPRLLALALLLLPTAARADWPQWRGPANDGVSPEKILLPSEWGADKNIVWKTKMPGPGSSTPYISHGKIFLTAQAGGDIVLACYGTDGTEQWTRKLGTGGGKFRNDEGNSASASCSTDGQLVFAFAGNGTLAAHDFAGNPKWVIDCQAKYGKFDIQFGAHWTPVLYHGRLYVQLFHRNAQQLVALDAGTGTEIWSVKRTSDSKPGTESPDVYASPVIWSKGDNALLLAHGNDYCTAHRLTDGGEVWRVGELNPKANYIRTWRAVSSPLATPDLIVVPSCKGGVTVGVDPAAAAGLILPGTPGEKWRMPRGTPDVPSPILADGVLYLMGERGTLTAVNPATGNVLASLPVTNERHRANPVYADGKLILVGRDGTMPVVKPGKDPELIAKNKLKDTFTASPAVTGGRIYLRGWDYLYAVGTK